MSRPLYVQMLGSDGQGHAAEPGRPSALCGVCGTGLLARVTGAFDVTCTRCRDQVIEALGLTPLNDLTNVQMRIVEDES